MKHCCSVWLAGWLWKESSVVEQQQPLKPLQLLSPARPFVSLQLSLPHPCTPFASGIVCVFVCLPHCGSPSEASTSVGLKRQPLHLASDNRLCAHPPTLGLVKQPKRHTHKLTNTRKLQQQSGISAAVLRLAPLSHRRVSSTSSSILFQYSRWHLICLDCIHPRSHPSVE